MRGSSRTAILLATAFACAACPDAPVAAADDGGKAASAREPSPACRPIDPDLIRHRLSPGDANRVIQEARRSGAGTISPAVVAAGLRQRRRALRRCYEEQLGCNPGLGGVLHVRLDVDESGRVDVAVEDDEPALRAAGVTDCVVDTLGRLDFSTLPPTGGLAAWHLPLTFLPPRKGTRR